MGQILMHDTWAEQDLDNYLKKYAEGSDYTSRRMITCDICGEDFDFKDGKVIDTCRCSSLRNRRGDRPTSIYLCRYCYNSAENIGEDEL